MCIQVFFFDYAVFNKFPADKGVTVGRERINDVVLNNAPARWKSSREHCTITADKGGNLFLEDHSSNGTTIVRMSDNDKDLIQVKGKKQPIFPTDMIILGDSMSGNLLRVQFIH